MHTRLNQSALRAQITLTHGRHAPLLSPDLTDALAELAATEELPLKALLAILLNEALAHRLRKRP